MPISTILIVLLAFLVGGSIAYMLRSKPKADDTGLKLILEQINELNRVVDSKIGESTRQMNDSVRTQLGESANLIREVTKGLTNSTKQIVRWFHLQINCKICRIS